MIPWDIIFASQGPQGHPTAWLCIRIQIFIDSSLLLGSSWDFVSRVFLCFFGFDLRIDFWTHLLLENEPQNGPKTLWGRVALFSGYRPLVAFWLIFGSLLAPLGPLWGHFGALVAQV